MPDFIKSFQLKQFTPIIHFQYYDDGATLRSTAFKPKLDEWIIQKVTGIYPAENETPKQTKARIDATHANLKEQHPEWLVGGAKGQHLALDYKMHISAKEKDSYLIASYIPKPLKREYDQIGMKYLAGVPFFADNEPIKNKQPERASRGIMYEDIQLEIFCLHGDLMEEIESGLPYVLAYNNFGTRQSKGFGCFAVAEESLDMFETRLASHAQYKEAMVYAFVGKFTPNLEKIFKTIDLEYKILKSGFGRDPSQLNEYFREKGIEWEKTIIKKELVKNMGTPRKTDYSDDQKYKYIRALLGVAELYEFPRDRGEKIKISCVDDDEFNSKKKTVERFRSPITFKVFDRHIYLLPEKIPDAVYNCRFEFKNRRGNYVILETPAGPFKLNGFLKNHVDNTWEYVNKQ